MYIYKRINHIARSSSTLVKWSFCHCRIKFKFGHLVVFQKKYMYRIKGGYADIPLIKRDVSIRYSQRLNYCCQKNQLPYLCILKKKFVRRWPFPSDDHKANTKGVKPAVAYEKTTWSLFNAYFMGGPFQLNMHGNN